MTVEEERPTFPPRLVVTMRATPSRLAEALTGHSWDIPWIAGTDEAFFHLAERALRRLVVMSPYLDNRGLTWVNDLFEHTLAVEKVLICRDYAKMLGLARPGIDRLMACGAQIFEYRILHAGDVGRQTLEETFHSKVVLADGVAAYVGSANMLTSSLETSLECGILVEGSTAR